MSIRTVYVLGASKKAINMLLTEGHEIWGTEYTPTEFNRVKLDGALPHRTVIKLYTKRIAGSPYATAYGQWDANRLQIR